MGTEALTLNAEENHQDKSPNVGQAEAKEAAQIASAEAATKAREAKPAA